MFGQDWEPVVFHKINPDDKPKHRPHGIQKVDKNREGFDHRGVPKDLADRIQTRRIELELTQVQLAQKINERPSIVNDIECCRGVYNHIHVNKILKALNLTLKQI